MSVVRARHPRTIHLAPSFRRAWRRWERLPWKPVQPALPPGILDRHLPPETASARRVLEWQAINALRAAGVLK
jgi:hypothetical protein